MAQIIDIRRVEVGPRSLTARVRVTTTAPLFTSEDLPGTARVYRLMPHIIEHACLGDASETFKDVMGDTEIAHLLEHVTVELLAQSDIAGDISCGRTYEVEGERRTYDVEIDCPDDVLVAGALSSAVWILQWAYSGGTDPEPDVEATVQGLVGLVETLPEPEDKAPSVVEYVISEEEAEQLIAEHGIFDNEPLEEYEGAEKLDEPHGAEPEGPLTSDGVKESPEARQASQDVPAPHVNPQVVPDVPEEEKPNPDELDPFDQPIPVEEEEIPDADFETVEEDEIPEAEFEQVDEAEAEPEPAPKRVIDERLVDEMMAELPHMRAGYAEPAPAYGRAEAEPEADSEAQDAAEEAHEVAADEAATTEPEAAEEPAEQAVEDLPESEADAESEAEEVAPAEEPLAAAADEAEQLAEEEEPTATEPVAEADDAPEAEYVAPGAPKLDEILHPAETFEVEVEVEVEAEPAPAAEPASDEIVDAAYEPVLDDEADDEDAAPEADDAAADPDGASERHVPEGLSWSTASSSGEWGSIPEPRFVR